MSIIKIYVTTLFAMLSFFAIAQVKTDFGNKELISIKGRFDKSYKNQVDFEIPAKDIKKLIEKEKTRIKVAMARSDFDLQNPSW